MAEPDEIITFADEDSGEGAPEAGSWKVAIIDDDHAVHDGTRYALYDYRLAGHGLTLLSAYSAAEGRELLRANPDTAVILLDVVMESDDSGLRLVEFIREELKNETVRIVLRTGQPGQAPERRVIVDYDVNDYKAKTELTADRLFTTITAALRSYQQLQRMMETRRGLEIIVDAASTLFDFKSMQKLAEGVLTQIASLFAVDCAGILVLRDAHAEDRQFSVLAGSGCYRAYAGAQTPDIVAPEARQLIQQAFQRRRTEFSDRRTVIYVSTSSGSEVVVLVEAKKRLSDTDRTLVEIFCGRLSIAFDNVVLYDELQRANATLERRVRQRTAELTSANERLQAQWLRARRAKEFQSEVLGTVAHDIKNPLGVILGRTEMMNEIAGRTPLPADVLRSQIGHIRESATRLTQMVNELISDALADADDITLRRERIDLAQLARDVVEANRPLAEKKGQTITVAAPAAAPVSCDPDRMRDAIDNLVSNAIKYSRRGGEVAVEVAVATEDVALSVRDSGPGLLPEDMTRLFGRFQRLSAKPTGEETSTGLGLSIAKRIVDLHDGAISAHSPDPGQGSVFRIVLKRDDSGEGA